MSAVAPIALDGPLTLGWRWLGRRARATRAQVHPEVASHVFAILSELDLERAPSPWHPPHARLLDLSAAWRDAPEDTEPAAFEALHEALEAALVSSHTRWWPVALEATRRFRATWLIAVVLLLLGVGAPQIFDLLRQAPTAAAWTATLGLGLAALVSSLQRLQYLRGRRQHPLMLGWIPFFWMRGQAHPEHLGEWPWDSDHPWHHAIVTSNLWLFTVTSPIWALLVYSARLLGDGAQTAAALIAIGGLLFHCAVFLDFAWYHGARWARRLTVVGLFALLAADNMVGLEVGVSIIGGLLGGALLLGLARAWRLMSPTWSRTAAAPLMLWTLGFVVAIVLNARTRTRDPWPFPDQGFPHIAALEDDGRPPALSLTPPHPTCRWPREDDTGPLVVLAMAGGGARSTQFAARTLETMASLDAKNHAQGLPATLDRLQILSSVSGGSLTAGAFLARRRRREPIAGLARALHRDFLYPVVTGWFTPGGDRTAGLIERWERPDLLGPAIRLSELADCSGRSALPLFNATTVEGSRVVLSPLDPWVYTQRPQAARAWTQDAYQGLENPRWVFDRDAVYGFDQLTSYDPTLAQAILASANFPFGFPPVRFRTRGELWRMHPPQTRGRTEGLLTDGGVLINSGLYTLYGLLLGQAEALRSRGVLLVVVDSSFMMPAPRPSKHLSLFVSITAKNSVTQRMHRAMLSHLEEIYGDRLQVAMAQMIPETDLDVSTTWYLPDAQYKRLHRSFDLQRPGLEAAITRGWEALHRPEGSSAPKRWPGAARPPMF